MFEHWQNWINEFEQACAKDEWSALEPLLTDDATYIVCGSPFACEIRGRQNVVSGFAKSIRGFDLKFDHRQWQALNIRSHEPNKISADILGHYQKSGAPDLAFGAHGIWVFRDNKISLMLDTYDLATNDGTQAIDWLARYGDGLDASYV